MTEDAAPDQLFGWTTKFQKLLNTLRVLDLGDNEDLAEPNIGTLLGSDLQLWEL